MAVTGSHIGFHICASPAAFRPHRFRIPCAALLWMLMLLVVFPQQSWSQQVSTRLEQVVRKQTPAVRWAAASPIAYGTPLGPAQLSATTTTPGRFLYTPSAGTVLDAGMHTLSVSFEPADGDNYNVARGEIALQVFAALPAVDLAASTTRVLLGTPVSLVASVRASGYPAAGQIRFRDSTNALASTILDDGQAAITAAHLSVGDHPLEADFPGSHNILAATSEVLRVTVLDYSIVSLADPASPPPPLLDANAVTFPLSIKLTSGDSLPQKATLTVTGLPSGAVAALSSPAWVQSSDASWVLNAGAPIEDLTLVVKTQMEVELEKLSSAKSAAVSVGACLVLLLPLCIRRRRLVVIAVSLLALASLLGGCGFTPGTRIPAGNYPLRVTVHAGELSRSVSLTLTVK